MLIHYILSAALSLKLIYISFSWELSEISLSFSCSSSLSFMVVLQNSNRFSVYTYQCRECHLFYMHIDHCTQSQGKSSNMLSVAGKILIQSIAKFLVLVRWSFNQLLTDHYVYPAIIVLLFYCGMLLTAFPPNPCLIVALVLKDIARNISSKSSLDSCSRIKGYCSQHFFQIRAW